MFKRLVVLEKIYIFVARKTGCSVARSSRLLWEQEVAGSNPATPTKKVFLILERLFYFNSTLSSI
ncbi:protein of unknown function [Tenacibaculum jejuense]|uniref:Uncharacterized protein n=1 Tax=Tenacibaculum jejuense TaxID=584609 RepID=A0A238U4X3_9FLAO|nr:protein of unknown function [Tenacibaculum jejuense]